MKKRKLDSHTFAECSQSKRPSSKNQIALAIKNSTLGDMMRCSLLVEGVIRECEGCTLSCICECIDDALEAYVEETTEVVSTFNIE